MAFINDIPAEFPKTRKYVSIPNMQEFLEKEKVAFAHRFGSKIKYVVTLPEFELISLLGSGSFGKVLLAKHKPSDRYFAIKVLLKKKIVKSKQIEHTQNELNVLEALRFPFVVHLECYFHDYSNIYFIMPLILGGELFHHLRKCGRFDENVAKFYGAQVLLALEYLHCLDLAYRDLKPENILIDERGYIKVTDFGFCKLVRGRTWTLCGTPEYLAPEVILSKGYGKSVDYWSYGVLLYEMCAGYPPFYARDHIILYEKIVHGKYKIASHFSNDLIDILQNILQLDLTKRYGNLRTGVNDIKQHKWFRSIDWIDVLNYKIPAPHIPQIKNIADTSNFDTSYDVLKIRVSETDHFKQYFVDF